MLCFSTFIYILLKFTWAKPLDNSLKRQNALVCECFAFLVYLRKLSVYSWKLRFFLESYVCIPEKYSFFTHKNKFKQRDWENICHGGNNTQGKNKQTGVKVNMYGKIWVHFRTLNCILWITYDMRFQEYWNH